MNLVTLQLIFYVVAIFSGLLGIFTFSLNWINRVDNKRLISKTYTHREKIDYYSSRRVNKRLTPGERNHAEKQLKRLLK